jgi:hypothetical protein
LAALGDPPPAVAQRLLEVSAADADVASRCIAVGALGEIAALHPEVLPSETGGALRRIAARPGNANLKRAAEHALRRLPA